MAAFSSLTAPGVVRFADRNIAYFSEENLSPAALMARAKEPADETVSKIYFSSVPHSILVAGGGILNLIVGKTLFELQTWLEQQGASVLAPVTRTKDAYVYIKGQKNYNGEVMT
jgi:hypothetical protein